MQNCYLRHYTTVFKPTEVLMMMTAFASMETVHIAAAMWTVSIEAKAVIIIKTSVGLNTVV